MNYRGSNQVSMGSNRVKEPRLATCKASTRPAVQWLRSRRFCEALGWPPSTLTASFTHFGDHHLSFS